MATCWRLGGLAALLALAVGLLGVTPATAQPVPPSTPPIGSLTARLMDALVSQSDLPGYARDQFNPVANANQLDALDGAEAVFHAERPDPVLAKELQVLIFAYESPATARAVLDAFRDGEFFCAAKPCQLNPCGGVPAGTVADQIVYTLERTPTTPAELIFTVAWRQQGALFFVRLAVRVPAGPQRFSNCDFGAEAFGVMRVQDARARSLRTFSIPLPDEFTTIVLPGTEGFQTLAVDKFDGQTPRFLPTDAGLVAGGARSYENGEFVITMNGPVGGIVPVPLPERFSDSNLSIAIIAGFGSAGTFAALACRSTAAGEYRFTYTPGTGEVRLVRRDASGETALGIPLELVDGRVDNGDGRVQLALACFGPTIVGAALGERGRSILLGADTAFGEGELWFGAGVTPGTAGLRTLRFDNLLLAAPAEPVPSVAPTGVPAGAPNAPTAPGAPTPTPIPAPAPTAPGSTEPTYP